jgi:hypothetical protein
MRDGYDRARGRDSSADAAQLAWAVTYRESGSDEFSGPICHNDEGHTMFSVPEVDPQFVRRLIDLTLALREQEARELEN